MGDALQIFTDNVRGPPEEIYWLWALSIAVGLYTLTNVASQHIPEDTKASISLWLQGDYESTWCDEFCTFFDGIFGSKHLSWNCIWRSTVFSLTSVLALYVLLDQVLDVLDFRAGGRLELWQALAIGAAVNVIPDYFSLYQTRWILGRFREVRSAAGQAFLLLADLIFTGVIIYMGISVYQLVRGEAVVPLPEMLFLFSIYAIFFYSTFTTSLWAWIFCLSSWVMRGFVVLGLNRRLPVKEKPVAQLALVLAVLSFAGLMAIRPLLEMGENGRAALDDRLCRLFPVVCDNVAPLTADEKLQLEYLARACRGGVDETCVSTANRLFGINDAEAAHLWRRACNRGDAEGCSGLGVLHGTGRGVEKSYSMAKELYEESCALGYANGCTNLGAMFEQGLGTSANLQEAARLYKEGCEKGSAAGCTNAGNMYLDARGGMNQSYSEAARFYNLGCSGGNPAGCVNLAELYRLEVGVGGSDADTLDLYRKGCEGGITVGCYRLGIMYVTGRGTDRDFAQAESSFRLACESGFAIACANLGTLYERGLGADQSSSTAAEYFRQACQGDVAHGCIFLAQLLERVAKEPADLKRVQDLYRRGCDLGVEIGCQALTRFDAN